MTEETRILNSIRNYVRKLPNAHFIKFSDKYTSGIPDCLVIRKATYEWGSKTYYTWFEVKTPKGKLSKIQDYTINKLKGFGCQVHVVRSLEEFKELL